MTVAQQRKEAWQAEKLVEAVAAMCRDAYILHRTASDVTAWHGGKYKPSPCFDGGVAKSGKRYKPIWPTLARFMIKHRLCPYVAIQALFAKSAETGRAPYPTHVVSPALLKLYRNAQREHEASVKASLLSNMGHARSRVMVWQTQSGLDRKAATVRVILDGDGVLSDLFCYCLARSEGLDKLAERYEVPALIQFLSAEEAYLEHWDKWLPEDFVELARRVSTKDLVYADGVTDGTYEE